jgi:hypothetical protein
MDDFEEKKILKEPWYKRCKYGLILLGIIILIIFIYWIFLELSYGNLHAQKDFLNQKVFEGPWLENCCSWWPISHFFLFAILGYLWPDCWLPFLVLGILWEFVESGMSIAVGTERQPIVTDLGKVEYSQNWWAGSSKDVVMDLFGLFAGKFLREFLDDIDHDDVVYREFKKNKYRVSLRNFDINPVCILIS